MELLKEIYRVPGLNTAGTTLHRQAVRGIILRGEELLMIHASQNGSCKFPGGGIEIGETHLQALAREIREECGMVLASTGAAFGRIVEYATAEEPEYDIFKMTSYYYYCQVQADIFAQKLDAYEKDMGFEPIWISIAAALSKNKAAAASNQAGKLFWNTREIFVLELLQKANPQE